MTYRKLFRGNTLIKNWKNCEKKSTLTQKRRWRQWGQSGQPSQKNFNQAVSKSVCHFHHPESFFSFSFFEAKLNKEEDSATLVPPLWWWLTINNKSNNNCSNKRHNKRNNKRNRRRKSMWVLWWSLSHNFFLPWLFVLFSAFWVRPFFFFSPPVCSTPSLPRPRRKNWLLEVFFFKFPTVWDPYFSCFFPDSPLCTLWNPAVWRFFVQIWDFFRESSTPREPKKAIAPFRSNLGLLEKRRENLKKQYHPMTN